MRIALIGNTLFNQGAEYVLATLARGLQQKGHAITVILSKCHDDCRRLHPDWKPFALPPEVKVIVQPKRRGRESVFSLRHLIRQGCYDVVMSHSSCFTYPLVLSMCLMRNRPVLIHVEHNSGIGVNWSGHNVNPPMTISRFLKNFAMRFVDAQFTVSKGTSAAVARVEGYPISRIYTVYNPVIDAVFEEKVGKGPVHAWLKDRAVPVVVAAGAFTPMKNHMMLLKAFAKVVATRPARLIIFGDGDSRLKYEQQIKELGLVDNVSLPGFTHNLPAELKNADCFVVSSTVESFSIVLVEALAAGLPVVATNCPYGPPELLKNGEYGILVENGNADEMAKGILRVLDGKGIRPTPAMVDAYRVDRTIERYETAMYEVVRRVRGEK